MENSEIEKHLKELKDLGIAMRRAQSGYFKQVKANKINGAAYVDTLALLNTCKASEKAFDTKIVELLELDRQAAQPELFLK